MNSRSSFGAALIICLGLSIYVFSSPTIATTNVGPKAQQEQEQQRTTFAYATLSINGATHIFNQGGAQLPIEHSLTSLMRSLESRERPTLVNLLNAIGAQGWELVQRDGRTWMFIRQE